MGDRLVPLARHLRPLALLWSASVLVAGMNCVATLLIVAQTSADVFAAYTMGLSVLMLSTNWTDAGLASTLTVLAAQTGNDPERLERYKRAGLRYARRIVPMGFVAAAGLAAVLFFQSPVFRARGDFYLLAVFVVIGTLTARTSFWNALLYASGSFRKSSAVQAAPPVARVILIGMAMAMTGLSFETLLVVTLLPIVLGWGLARYAWSKIIGGMSSMPDEGDESETSARVWQFLKPTTASTIFNSISYNITLLGASFFTAGVPIAGYGVFQRLNQIIVILVGPLNAYVGRQLYMTLNPCQRKHKARLYLAIGTVIYTIYGLLAFVGYWLIGRYVSHYSLAFPLEFFFSLLSNLFGYFYVMLDTVLASSGTASHRFRGTLFYVCLNTLLVLIIRPNSLLAMVVIDTVSLLPSVGYFSYRFARNRQ